MGEIKRYTIGVVTGSSGEIKRAYTVPHTQGELVMFEDHQQAVAEAETNGVRRWLENVDKTHTCDKCSIGVYCKTSETCIREDVLHDLIKKAEA